MTFHHLPIVNSRQEVIGIISSNDMLKSLALKLPMLKQSDEETLNMMFDIRDLMTPDPQVISSDATINEALSIFSKHHIHALPVIDENELVGIITSNDVLGALNS
jgi:CBS domain-containing protein